MRVNAFGLGAGWKLCAKMRLSAFTHMIFRGSKLEAEKVEVGVGEVAAPVHILAVDDLRHLWMQHQLAGREAVRNSHPECPRLLGALAVTNEVSRAEESHRRALAEPDMKLAPHPAPIARPRPYRRRQWANRSGWRRTMCDNQ